MGIPANVQKDLVKLLPASILNEIACFTFYDTHPQHARNIDITVCTHRGEVIEFYDRDIISSILVKNLQNAQEIITLRNEKCNMFYLLLAENEMIILSTNETLQIHRRVKNVERYELIDKECNGQPRLKVTCKDDAVPVLFDSNFNISQPILASENKYSSDSMPLMTQLLRKLTEAKFNVKKNEGVLNDYIKLKQTAAFSMYEQGTHNNDDSIFKLGTTVIEKALKIKTTSPILKVCNKKVIIIINVRNEDNVPIENSHILLHGTSKQSFSYVTKIFKQVSSPPYWQESTFHCSRNNEHFFVAIVDLRELKYNIPCKIEFEVALSYRKSGKSYLLPLENVLVTTLDTMGQKFDVILDNEDDQNKILAILATCEKTNLVLKHIREINARKIDIYEEICKHLEFEVLFSMKNVLVYKKSPYHILYGLTIIMTQPHEIENSIRIEVYSRSSAQVLAFIHLLYDAVPYRLMATLPDYRISAKNEDLSHCNNDVTESTSQLDYSGHASAILNQAKLLIEYFDKYMIKMNESADQDVLNDIGNKIHLLSLGLPDYLKLRNQLLDEAMSGIQTSLKPNTVIVDSQEMMIDE